MNLKSLPEEPKKLIGTSIAIYGDGLACEDKIEALEVETDRLWDALTADGGQESRCGRLIDRFGVSWQIVPNALVRMLNAEDREAANRAMEAMVKMKKIEIADIESAFRGEGNS